MPLENPFPLNIDEKQDTWEKLQLLQNIASTFKVPAAEFNKIVQALEYIYSYGDHTLYLGYYTTYALFIAAHPVGARGQYAFLEQDQNEVDGLCEYRWNETNDTWEKETSTNAQGPVFLQIQGSPFIGLASLFLRFDFSLFKITQIQGGGIFITFNPDNTGMKTFKLTPNPLPVVILDKHDNYEVEMVVGASNVNIATDAAILDTFTAIYKVIGTGSVTVTQGAGCTNVIQNGTAAGTGDGAMIMISKRTGTPTFDVYVNNPD